MASGVLKRRGGMVVLLAREQRSSDFQSDMSSWKPELQKNAAPPTHNTEWEEWEMRVMGLMGSMLTHSLLPVNRRVKSTPWGVGLLLHVTPYARRRKKQLRTPGVYSPKAHHRIS